MDMHDWFGGPELQIKYNKQNTNSKPLRPHCEDFAQRIPKLTKEQSSPPLAQHTNFHPTTFDLYCPAHIDPKKIFVHKICQMQNENHKKSNISFARSTSTSKTYWSDAILVPKSPWTSPFLTFWNTSLILLLRTKTSFVLRYESFNLVFGFLGKLYFDCLPCKIALNKLVK